MKTIAATAILAMVLTLAGCGEGADESNVPARTPDLPEPSGPPVVQQVERDADAPQSEAGWDSIASGEGTALRLNDADGALAMSVACLANPARLVVNVPSFSPVGSEDRFALGLGDEPVTLVADPTRQELRPGVTAEGPIPQNIEALLAGAERWSANYGYQNGGPYPAPPNEATALLATACADLRG